MVHLAVDTRGIRGQLKNSPYHTIIWICPSVCLFVRLSIYYLLRRLWTDRHQTRHEGQDGQT